MELVDRTEHTANITSSRQRSKETGRFLRIFQDPDNRTRPISGIDSIVLHQTGFLHSARGNRESAYDHTIAHFVVMQNGVVLKVRDIDVRLNNILALEGIHIEIVGKFWSIRHRDFCRLRESSSRDFPSMEQILAVRDLIGYLVNSFPETGVKIEFLLAHAQVTTRSKPNCPGPHIWFNIARWALTKYQLSSGGHGARSVALDWEDARFRLPLVCDEEPMAHRDRLIVRPDGLLAYSHRRTGHGYEDGSLQV